MNKGQPKPTKTSTSPRLSRNPSSRQLPALQTSTLRQLPPFRLSRRIPTTTASHLANLCEACRSPPGQGSSGMMMMMIRRPSYHGNHKIDLHVAGNIRRALSAPAALSSHSRGLMVHSWEWRRSSSTRCWLVTAVFKWKLSKPPPTSAASTPAFDPPPPKRQKCGRATRCRKPITNTGGAARFT